MTDRESEMEEEENIGTLGGGPVPLAEIARLRRGENGLREHEIWAICSKCCSKLESILQTNENGVRNVQLCPENIVYHPDGNVTISYVVPSTFLSPDFSFATFRFVLCASLVA